MSSGDTGSDFLHASVQDLVASLTLEEKISLLCGPDWWSTSAVDRLNVPSVRMSDGPNGVRGSSHFMSSPAQCLPCGTALGATFDPQLIGRVGNFLAAEAKLKSAVVLLAPTINIQRSPLGGRCFESFSEDPTLSGLLASAYVNGVQSQGVACTIKHFVCNEQEHERTAVDAIVSQRALREVYLYPFMLAQINSKPWAFMTAYGRLNGTHCSENKWLLRDILRGEWSFDGVVISDWYGTYSVDLAIKAGLDMEMPGPTRWRSQTLVTHMLSAQKLLIPDIDELVEHNLEFVQKLAKSSPEVVFGDQKERTRESERSRAFCRQLAAESIVLLKNADGLLPLSVDKTKIRSIAVVGSHAKASIISGGGSAALKPSYVVTPWDGIQQSAPPYVKLEYAVGAYAHKYLPTLESLLTAPNGAPGWLCTFYTMDADESFLDAVSDCVLNDTRVKLNDALPQGLGDVWGIKLRGLLNVTCDTKFELGLAVAGRAKLYIDGKLIIDNWSSQTPGDFFYGQGTVEERAVITLRSNTPKLLEVEYISSDPSSHHTEKDLSQPALMRGLRLGGVEAIDEDQSIKDAATLASQSDCAIVIVGLTPEWESEGFDRPDLALPRKQNELIQEVAKANKCTVVVLQAGSAIDMQPWIDSVSAILMTWYLGNECGNAIADIVYGKVNPCAKLPISFPRRIEDTPSFAAFGSENGRVVYREDIFVGYRHYQARKINPLFAFGHGLSYTSFNISDIAVKLNEGNDFTILVSCNVQNVGRTKGSEVVQVYISLPPNGVTSPVMQLKGIAKARDLAPGAETELTITLNKYAISYWDDLCEKWTVKRGRYEVNIGTSSDRILLRESLDLMEGFTWVGL